MSTETQQAQPANGSAKPTAALARRPEGEGTIDAFASEDNFAVAQRMGQALANSSLVPDTFRGNLPNVLIAMEVASRIRASVFAVMQNMDVIHGRPSFRATFLIATVNASGRFTPLRFRFEGPKDGDAYGCRAVATDRESGEVCEGALITIGLAKAEGWATKNGSKWRTMAEQMLMYRAAAFWTRVYAPELSLGMTSDEAEDVHSAGVVDEIPPVPGADQPGRKLSLRRAEPVVVLDAEETQAQAVETVDDPPRQRRAKKEQPVAEPPPVVERQPGEDDA